MSEKPETILFIYGVVARLLEEVHHLAVICLQHRCARSVTQRSMSKRSCECAKSTCTCSARLNREVQVANAGFRFQERWHQRHMKGLLSSSGPGPCEHLSCTNDSTCLERIGLEDRVPAPATHFHAVGVSMCVCASHALWHYIVKDLQRTDCNQTFRARSSWNTEAGSEQCCTMQHLISEIVLSWFCHEWTCCPSNVGVMIKMSYCSTASRTWVKANLGQGVPGVHQQYPPDFCGCL